MQTENISMSDWPMDGLEAVNACPLCGIADRSPLHFDLRDYFFEAAPGSWNLYQCLRCHSAYLDPRPNAGTIALAYSRYYTHQAHSTPRGVIRGLWRAFRNDYIRATFGVDFGTSRWPGRWLLRALPMVRCGIDSSIGRNLEVPGGGRRLLDVGCGNGGYLDFARRAGWVVKGIDLDAAAVAVARASGLDVIVGTIDCLSDESECYDRITLSHVLEHVHAPWDLLAHCYRLLKPGGVLWLETPNVCSDGMRSFGKYWRGIEPPRHLQLFSRKSLVDQLELLGFSNICDPFSTFASISMWRESRLIMKRAGAQPRLRHSFAAALAAEFHAMGSRDSREFITVMCAK